MSTITLTGNGKDRNVDDGPVDASISATPAPAYRPGSPTFDPDGLLDDRATSTIGNDFTIREIKIERRPVFELDDFSGNSHDARRAGATKKFDIVFGAGRSATSKATATLYLDEDRRCTALVPIRGRALFVDAHGARRLLGGRRRRARRPRLLVLGALFAARRRRRAPA